MGTSYYPIALRLKGRRVLIVGGGKVAERKVKKLLEIGARVRIVSPCLTVGLRKLLKDKKINWLNRAARSLDARGMDIVIAATEESAVNRDVSRWAKERGALVNVVDQPSLSSFISPAILRRRKAIIAVYTDGKDPVLSRDLKNFLKEHWDEFMSYRHRLPKSKR